METRKAPETPDQITDFLLCCLYVLQSICHWKQMEMTIAQIFAYSIRGADKEKMKEKTELMLPHSIRCTVQIRDLLEGEEGQWLLEYLPVPYCDIDTVLWILRRHVKKNFPDLSSAFHACDRSISLRWKKTCRSPRERKNHSRIVCVLETYLEDRQDIW